MSHTPPVPESAQSPYPAGGARATGQDEQRHKLAEAVTANLKSHAGPAANGSAKGDAAGRGLSLRTGAAIGSAAIGSAAIAAALIYYNRSRD